MLIYRVAVCLIRIDRCTLSSVLSIYERRIHNTGMRDSCTINLYLRNIKNSTVRAGSSILGERRRYIMSSNPSSQDLPSEAGDYAE